MDSLNTTGTPESIISLRFNGKKKYLIAFVIVVIALVCYLSSPPSSGSKKFTIEQGQSLESVANELEELGIIRSTLMFTLANHLFGSAIQAGDYKLKDVPNTFNLVWSLAKNKVEREFKKIVIPEGSTVAQIAEIAKKVIPNFSESRFIEFASPYEGYLFPDTYFVDDSLDEKNFIDQMRDNFKVKTKSLLAGLGKEKISEVMTIASILEEEGKTTESRKLIAGILYKRLAAGIALQVDATFIYVNGKQSKINFQDLAIDSPFNTYKYKGLPPHPITNPGLDSIKAALEPTSSPYLYYMSDAKSNIYYARTFEEHKENRAKYE